MVDYATGQPKARQYAMFYDQHGRAWGATTENKTRHPCGPYEAQYMHEDRGWVAKPIIMPHQSYFVLDAQNPTKVTIAYDRWLLDIRHAKEEWNKQLRTAAKEIYGQGAIAQAIRNPQKELLDAVGPPPETLPEELIEACIAGNKWVLGLSTKVPSWAHPIIAELESKKIKSVVEEIAISNRYPDVEDEGDDVPQESEPLEEPEPNSVPGSVLMIAPGKWGIVQEDGQAGRYPDGEWFRGNRAEAAAAAEQMQEVAV